MLDSEESLISVLKKLGVTEDYVLIWGTGEAYREFLCVDDLTEACVLLMENINYKDIGELINIGTGTYIKINELADIIKKIVGFEGKIKHDPSKPDGTPRKLLDVSKARSLGWEAKISLQEGIRKTYDWYCNVQHA
jgi:GDP-L-fucose synthase